jgi:hypothetical protein
MNQEWMDVAWLLEVSNNTKECCYYYYSILGKQYIMLTTPATAAAIHRPLAQEIFRAPVLTYAQVNVDPKTYRSKFKSEVVVFFVSF